MQKTMSKEIKGCVHKRCLETAWSSQEEGETMTRTKPLYEEEREYDY